MTLIEQIRSKYLELRKAHNAAAVASLSTLIGEIENAAKNGKTMTDADVVNIVKKFIKNIDEAISAVLGGIPDGVALKDAAEQYHRIGALNEERKLYEQFLPKQLNEAELMFVIDELVSRGLTNVGAVMKALKAYHGGHYDGALASKILKAKF